MSETYIGRYMIYEIGIGQFHAGFPSEHNATLVDGVGQSRSS